jgi:uncharacterized membrane protein
MHCVNCGAELGEGVGLCAKCGARAGEAGGAGTAPPASSSLPSNVASGLCYLAGFITGIFFLVAEPYKRDHAVRFHAFQSIFLSVAWFAVYFALGLLLSVVPGILWRVSWMLHSAVSFGFFCLWLFLMFKAYNNEQFKLPVIGDLAAKQA